MDILSSQRFAMIYLFLFAVNFIVVVIIPGLLTIPHFGMAALRILMVGNVLIAGSFLYVDTKTMEAIKSSKLSVSPAFPGRASSPLLVLFVLSVLIAASALIPAILLAIALPSPHSLGSWNWR